MRDRILNSGVKKRRSHGPGHRGRLIFPALFWVSVLFAGPVSGQVAKGTLPDREATPVIAALAVKQTVRPVVRLIGTAEPSMTSTVASEIESMVTAYLVRKGQRVSKGDMLARVEKTHLNLNLKQAEALLAETSENYKNARSEFQRSEELFRKKTISSRRYDEALYAASAMKQKILSLEARIEAIKYDLMRCTIRAPFSGFVVEEHTQIGQWLKAGGAVVTLVKLDPVLVTVPVPDRYINTIQMHQALDLSFEFLPGNPLRKGRVRHIIPQGNEKARTFPVQIVVKNPEGTILPGMSCRVSLPVGTPYDAVLVQKDGVVTQGEDHHLFVVRHAKAVFVPVKKGQAQGGLVVVEGDLKPGEPVVVEGNERLRPGQRVRIIKGTEG